jgi:magnesium transporter
MDAHELLSRSFVDSHPEEAAHILEGMPAEEAAGLLLGCPVPAAGQVLRRMTAQSAAECLTHLPAAETTRMLATLPLRTSAAITRRMPEVEREAVFAAMPEREGRAIRRLLRYPPGTAGALMDPAVLTVPVDFTVGDALERVTRTPELLVHYVYIVDDQERLVGVLSLPELLSFSREASVRDVMQSKVVHLSVGSTQYEIAASRHWRRYAILPVVDRGGILAGQIRHSTIWDLEHIERGDRTSDVGLETLLAMGELYWLGLSELLSILPLQWIGRRERESGGEPHGRKP